MFRRPIGAAVVASALVLAAGCGDPDNVYVANERAGVFLKLPNDWTTFQVERADPTANPRTSAEAGEWSVIVDAADQPLRSHLEEAAPEAPVGMLQIIPTPFLQDPEGNPISLTNQVLRALLLNLEGDPLTEPGVEVVKYVEVDLGHHWGIRLTAKLSQAEETEVQVTQFAFVDAGGKRLYRFRLLCSVACYAEHEDEINAVLDSWTLEGR